MIYGYIRVSTTQQDTEKQKFELFNLAYSKSFKIDEFIEETVSGSKPYSERLLGELIRKLSKDDVLLVTELSRFGRSLLEIMEIMSKLSCWKKKSIITFQKIFLSNLFVNF